MTKLIYWQLKVFGGGILALLTIVYLAYQGWNTPNLILTGILGGILGWITGILFSPKDEKEAKTFTDFRAGIAAFLGGIAIAKIEQYMVPYLNEIDKTPILFANYFLYFTISFGLGLLITFVGRMADIIFEEKEKKTVKEDIMFDEIEKEREKDILK